MFDMNIYHINTRANREMDSYSITHLQQPTYKLSKSDIQWLIIACQMFYQIQNSQVSELEIWTQFFHLSISPYMHLNTLVI